MEKAAEDDYTLQNDPLLEVIDGREWQNVPPEEQRPWMQLAQKRNENLKNTPDYVKLQRLQRAIQFIESCEALDVSKQKEDEPNLIASNKANKEMAQNMAAIDNNSKAIEEKRRRTSIHNYNLHSKTTISRLKNSVKSASNFS